MHNCIRTNIFVIYQGFWFLEPRGSLLVLANVVKFPTWYSHSWNFTGPQSPEVWTETRWLMNDSTPPQTQPLYFWFTLLRVSGCVWLQSLILQRVCVCVLESWRKRATEFNQVFSQVWPDSSPNTAAIRAAYPSEIFRVNNLYSSCYAPPKSCLSDMPVFYGAPGQRLRHTKPVSLVFLPWSWSRQQQRSGFYRSALFHPNTSSIHTLIGLFNNDVWL